LKPTYEDGKFFVREGKKLYATPLFLSLLLVESSDIMFALDSVPAILAISRDPFIVYTSNIFAILGSQVPLLYRRCHLATLSLFTLWALFHLSFHWRENADLRVL
jgi:hypothetical protein